MRSALYVRDGDTMASVYFPTRLVQGNVYSFTLDIADLVVDLTHDGEVVYIELFNPPLLPKHFPLPFVYDPRHDTYDIFFAEKTPPVYACRSTDEEDIDVLYGADNTKVIGVRICNARKRLPGMDI